jgi:hypothetical protein
MDPIFTLPYSEFVVAQQLARLLPASKGYSLHAPISRQQQGIDLLITRRRRSEVRAASIQVKSSRTYSHPATPARTTRPSFRYYTWFKNFDCPTEADFFCLVALYPAVDATQRRELGSWWAPQVLLFSQKEMRHFLRNVRTVSGKPDRMFAFGFDHPDHAFQTRGDSARSFADFSRHVLRRRIGVLASFLSHRGGAA